MIIIERWDPLLGSCGIFNEHLWCDPELVRLSNSFPGLRLIGCTVPTRLLALQHGATLVWGPEIVDKAILHATREVDCTCIHQYKYVCKILMLFLLLYLMRAQTTRSRNRRDFIPRRLTRNLHNTSRRKAVSHISERICRS
jgi:hypothetical protein